MFGQRIETYIKYEWFSLQENIREGYHDVTDVGEMVRSGGKSISRK